MLTSKVYKLSKHDVEVHWGELGNRQKRSLPPEICKAVIMGAVKQENPKDYFPELLSSIFSLEEEEDGGLKLPPDQCPVNEVIRHTIRLNLYSKRVQRFIRVLAARKTAYHGAPVQELRKVPEMIVRRKERPQRFYRFGLGQGPPLPTLDKDLIHKMLEKAVIVILVQTGYDRTRKTALDTLVDVVKELIMKICLFCHSFAQKDLNRGQVAYNDVLEKSLRTVGFDGIQSISDYYKKKILLKRDRAHARARRLLVFYDKMLSKYGVANSSDNIPELHFPATGKQSSEALHAILKPGYKMLQTFDQETQQSNGLPPNPQ